MVADPTHIDQLTAHVDPGKNNRVTYSQTVELLSEQTVRVFDREVPILQQVFETFDR